MTPHFLAHMLHILESIELLQEAEAPVHSWRLVRSDVNSAVTAVGVSRGALVS